MRFVLFVKIRIRGGFRVADIDLCKNNVRLGQFHGYLLSVTCRPRALAPPPGRYSRSCIAWGNLHTEAFADGIAGRRARHRMQPTRGADYPCRRCSGTSSI